MNTPKVNAELLGETIHNLVLDIVQMRKLDMEWDDVSVAAKALSLDHMFKAIEIEEKHHDQIISTAWINGYGRVIRVISTANGGLHQHYINEYSKKKLLAKGDVQAATSLALEALTQVWTLFELTREVAPTIAALMIGSSNALVGHTKSPSPSKSLALDYIRWRLTGGQSQELSRKIASW